jgi:ATP-dependent Clp protease ATP-binding subunit ClpB
VIQRSLQNPLATLILESQVKDGDTVKVTVENGELVVGGQRVSRPSFRIGVDDLLGYANGVFSVMRSTCRGICCVRLGVTSQLGVGTHCLPRPPVLGYSKRTGPPSGDVR